MASRLYDPQAGAFGGLDTTLSCGVIGIQAGHALHLMSYISYQNGDVGAISSQLRALVFFAPKTSNIVRPLDTALPYQLRGTDSPVPPVPPDVRQEDGRRDTAQLLNDELNKNGALCGAPFLLWGY